MPRPLYIFDLDGTLADIEHRRHLVEWRDCPQCHGCGEAPGVPSCPDCAGTGRLRPDWRAFYAACVDDRPNTPVIQTLALVRAFADVLIFSGRSDEVREQTEAWLLKHTPLTRRELESRLLMRAEGDYTPDEVLKRGWLEAMAPEARARLVAVFDDRDKVVAMWRAAGVSCFQVAPGDF